MKNLKKYFDLSGMSFEKFASITGLPQSSLNRYVNGKVKAPVAVVPILEKGLNLEPGTLLDLYQVSEKEKRLVVAYRNQPHLQQTVDSILGVEEPTLRMVPQDAPAQVAAFTGGDNKIATNSSNEKLAAIDANIDDE